MARQMFFEKIATSLQETKLPVTCRWLSQSSKIPADLAKKLLYTYWRQTCGDSDAVRPTFCISGFVDNGSLLVSLVEHDQIKEFQTRLKSILSIHVYSLQSVDSDRSSPYSCASFATKESLPLYPHLSEISLGDAVPEKLKGIRSEDRVKNQISDNKESALKEITLLTASERTMSVKKTSQSDKNVPESDKKASQSDKKAPESDKKASQSDKKASQSDKKASQFDKKASQSDKKASQSDKKASQSNKKASQSDKKVPECDKKASQSDKKASQSEERSTMMNIESESHSDVLPVQAAKASSQSTTLSSLFVSSSGPLFPEPPVLPSAAQPPPPEATPTLVTTAGYHDNEQEQMTRKRPCFDSDSCDSSSEPTKEEAVATKPAKQSKRVKRLKTRMYTTTDGEMVTEKYYGSDSTEASDHDEKKSSRPSSPVKTVPHVQSQPKRKIATKQKSITSFFMKH